jgi:hypothetical protein
MDLKHVQIAIWRSQMAEEVVPKNEKGEEIEEIVVRRPPRARLSPEESLKRMQEFDQRREQFIASVRKGKG